MLTTSGAVWEPPARSQARSRLRVHPEDNPSESRPRFRPRRVRCSVIVGRAGTDLIPSASLRQPNVHPEMKRQVDEQRKGAGAVRSRSANQAGWRREFPWIFRTRVHAGFVSSRLEYQRPNKHLTRYSEHEKHKWGF